MSTIHCRRPLVGFSLLTLAMVLIASIASIAPFAAGNDDSDALATAGIEREGDIPLPVASVA